MYSAELVHKELINVLLVTVVKDIFFHTKPSFLVGFWTKLAVSKWDTYKQVEV